MKCGQRAREILYQQRQRHGCLGRILRDGVQNRRTRPVPVMIHNDSGERRETLKRHYRRIRGKHLLGGMTRTGAIMVVLMRRRVPDLCGLRALSGMLATAATSSRSRTDFLDRRHGLSAVCKTMTPADRARLQQQRDHQKSKQFHLSNRPK